MNRIRIALTLVQLVFTSTSFALTAINPTTGDYLESQIKPVQILQFKNADFDRILITHASGELNISNLEQNEDSKLEVVDQISIKDCETKYVIENRALIISTEKKVFVIKNECKQNLNVSLPNNKPLSVSLGTGVIKIKGVFPSVEANLGSGEVNIQGKVSKLDLDVASGSVTVSGLDGYGKITLLSGDLDIKYSKKTKKNFNQLFVSKSVGNTRIQLPKGTKAESKLKTLLGQISNDIQQSETGKFYFSVKTNVGDIWMDTY